MPRRTVRRSRAETVSKPVRRPGIRAAVPGFSYPFPFLPDGPAPSSREGFRLTRACSFVIIFYVMKGRKKLIGKLLPALLFCVLTASLLLSGCGPRKPAKPITYGDIYVSRPEVSRYSPPGDPVLILGEGVSVPYTQSKTIIGSGDKDYSTAYIKEGDFLLCERADGAAKSYGLYMLGADPVRLMGDGIVYSSISVKNGYAVCAGPDGSLSLFDLSGKGISLPEGTAVPSGLATDRYLIPLGEDLFAVRVHPKTDRYRILSRRGDAAEVLSDPEGTPFEIPSSFYGKDKNVRFGLSAADGYILRTEYASSGVTAVKDVHVYDVRTRSLLLDVFEHYGEYTPDTVRAVFYLGNDKLYCCQRLKTAEGESFTCSVPDEKGKKENYRVFSWLRDLRDGTETRMGKRMFFLSLFNSYNAADAPLDINSFLRKGYSYVSLGYRIEEDGTAVPEQYIMDSDLHPYVSMTSREGTATRYGDAGDDYRDVLLTFVGGTGFSPDSEGDVLLYDSEGWNVLRIPGNFSGTKVNNGVICATEKTGEGDSRREYRAAFNLDGTPVFDPDACRYTELSAFVGGYALARTEDSKAFILDSRGKHHEVPGLHVGKKSSRIVFKDGVYFSESRDASGTLRVGLRATFPDGDRNLLVEEKYYRIVLVERRGGGLYCMALTEKENGVWEIYRLA